MTLIVIKKTVFESTPITDVAALAARYGFSRRDAQRLTEAWEVLQGAEDAYKFWAVTKEDEDFRQYWSDVNRAAKLLEAFHFNSRKIGNPRLLPADQAKSLIRHLTGNHAPAPALTPEPLSNDPLEQFSNVDIAYAAALLKWNVASCVEAWDAIRTAEDTCQALPDDQPPTDDDHELYASDLHEAHDLMNGLGIAFPLDATPSELAVALLAHLRLIE